MNGSNLSGIACGINPDAPIGQVICDPPSLALRESNRPKLAAAGRIIDVDKYFVTFGQPEGATDYTGIPEHFVDAAVDS